MTTNLTFTTSATETLRGGTDYNITQTGGATNVGLTFARPSTIDSDTVTGNESPFMQAVQTLNFSIMNLDALSAGNDASVTLDGTVLNNKGEITVGDYGQVTIDTQVLGGAGTLQFTNGGLAEINSMVGGGQSFEVHNSGALVIDKPSKFFGHLTMENTNFIDLVGLMPTSYDFSNDLLTLWKGNRVIDRTHLTVNGDLIVSQYYVAGTFPAGVFLSSVPHIGPTPLPVHAGV